MSDRRSRTAIARRTAKRAVRSAILWGALFGVLVMDEALRFASDFPTIESRRAFADSFGRNSGLTAIVGPARRLDTVQGYVAWRMFWLMMVVGAVWGLLSATRLLRGEEDSGLWELLLAGRTSRRHATAQALTGMVAGFIVLWGVTAVFTVVAGRSSKVGFSTSASLFYVTAGVISALMFLAIGALTSQLGATRRQANALGALVFAVAFLIRLVADAGTGLAWMRWASPLGWVENLRPLTGSQPLALLPIAMLIVLAGGAALHLAGRRDLAAGMLPHRTRPPANRWFLRSPARLVVRLDRWVAVAWIAGLGVTALVFGIVARTAGSAGVAASTVEEQVGKLGGDATGATAWLGYEFLYVAAILAFAAAGQISALRSEEADGHLDNVFARSVSRDRWLAGRLGFAVGLVVLAALATGIGGWAGVAGHEGGVALTAMLQAGINVAAPALLVIGVGTLLYGFAPRLAAPLLYALVLWSFLVEIIGSSITTNHWLLDTAVLSHLGPVPASDLNWTAITWLTAIGAAAALAGLAGFNRRDLVSA